MSIKNQTIIFRFWQQNVIRYEKYRIRKPRNKHHEIAIDVYTKTGKYIKLRKLVTSEEALLDEIIKIIELYEGQESAGLYREMAQK